ncbi:MAG: hypothetical protein HFJ42_10170 [Clostridia bacterium]|nr:hypothetical protein [Clostridia bacterium]
MKLDGTKKVAESWLFVPAIEKYLYGNKKEYAQNIIYDLEDSLKDNQKDSGLRLLEDILPSNAGEQDIYVRINIDGRLEHELQVLKKFKFSGYMIPKFENLDILDRCRDLLEGRRIIALIESPAGVIRLRDFAEDVRIYGFAFGGEDFCSCLGVATNDDATRYAREKIVLWAAYVHKIALDTVCFETEDMAYFRKCMEESLRMGFESRLLIHPRQLGVLEDMREDIDKGRMERIVRQYETGETGVAVIDGIVYERPHIKRLQRLLKERDSVL